MCVCVCVCVWERERERESVSCVQLSVTPWSVALQVPLSMEFSRQEHWSGSPCPSPGDLPDPGIKPGSPELQADSLLTVWATKEAWFGLRDGFDLRIQIMCICLVHNKHLEVLRVFDFSCVYLLALLLQIYALQKNWKEQKMSFLHYCILVSFKAARANTYNRVSLEVKNCADFFKLVPTLLSTVVPHRHVFEWWWQ